MSPVPVTVTVPPACWNPEPGAPPPTVVPAQRWLGEFPLSVTWSKWPVASVSAPRALDPVSDWLPGIVVPGVAANSPACAVLASPARCTGPTLIQCAPSAESYPVIVPPERVSRSQRGAAGETAPGSPAISLVKSYCIRMP